MPLLPLLLILASTIAAPVLPVTPEVGNDPPGCTEPMRRTATPPHPPSVTRLGDLPPANHYLAVDRRVGRCRRPVVLSTGIGRR